MGFNELYAWNALLNYGIMHHIIVVNSQGINNEMLHTFHILLATFECCYSLTLAAYGSPSSKLPPCNPVTTGEHSQHSLGPPGLWA